MDRTREPRSALSAPMIRVCGNAVNFPIPDAEEANPHVVGDGTTT